MVECHTVDRSQVTYMCINREGGGEGLSNIKDCLQLSLPYSGSAARVCSL